MHRGAEASRRPGNFGMNRGSVILNIGQSYLYIFLPISICIPAHEGAGVKNDSVTHERVNEKQILSFKRDGVDGADTPFLHYPFLKVYFVVPELIELLLSHWCEGFLQNLSFSWSLSSPKWESTMNKSRWLGYLHPHPPELILSCINFSFFVLVFALPRFSLFTFPRPPTPRGIFWCVFFCLF